jgi:hypothetical protein
MTFRPFQLIVGTRRGLWLLALNAFAAFGLFSAAIQFYSAVWEPQQNLPYPGRIALGVAVVSLIYGVIRAWPRRQVQRVFGRPDITVVVTVGDLFEQDAHLVIGFNDVFDTDTTNGAVINPTSVQGQFQERIYGNDLGRLDADLSKALQGTAVSATERRNAKQRGKLKRYPIGTVATLGDAKRRFFCVAYSKMQNNLIAKSTVDSLWQSLSSLWDAVYLHGHRGTVAIPIVGSQLAKINCLDRESLLRMILLSYVARSREELVCKKLIVVIHQRDYDRVNMLEVDAFLKTL